MFQKEWEVLIVDDEPDMVTVTRLALKNVKVYGVPLKLHFCASKAEALELLNTKGEYAPVLAVALIDVVMETDTAGLDLCKSIREERRNQLTQLFIRTGQPGTAPEREVVDRYDINGYFTKAEATDDKLYSMIKSGVRQYYWSIFTLRIFTTMGNVSSLLGSRAAISALLQNGLNQAFHDRSGKVVASYTNMNFSYIFGDEVVANAGWSEQTALSTRDRLDQLEGLPLSPSGKYVINENNQLLIRVSPGKGNSYAYIVATVAFQVPDFVPTVLGAALTSQAAIWYASA
ncbi:MAG: response regulator [Candidatus Eremiobacteraeota bacterium]|nr:response regulator [Candidatus Eremiobacteraeota bacterium]MCW5872702.1 response regulator [Candidatus Eremiobacteraeota bacterium]